MLRGRLGGVVGRARCGSVALSSKSRVQKLAEANARYREQSEQELEHSRKKL